MPSRNVATLAPVGNIAGLSKDQENAIKGAGITIETLTQSFKDGKLSLDDIQGMLVESEITEDDVITITGAKLPDVPAIEEPVPAAVLPANPSIGHNSDGTVDPIAMEMRDRLSHFKATVGTAEEANSELLAALGDAREHQAKNETSLPSRLAISAANYISFHVAGLQPDGNGTLVVTRGFETRVRSAILEMIPAEERDDSTLKTSLLSAIQRSILLMVGKAHIGYFVMAGKRKVPQVTDIALAEKPENIPEDATLLRAVCIKSNVLTPRIPGINNRVIVSWHKNESEDLRLMSGDVAGWLYQGLWDKSGELQYDADPLSRKTGNIAGFKIGTKVAADAAKAAADIAAAKVKFTTPTPPPISNTVVTNPAPANGTTPAADTRAPGGATAIGEPDSLKETIRLQNLQIVQLRASLDGKKEAFPAAIRVLVSDTTSKLTPKFYGDLFAGSKLAVNRLSNLYNDKLPPKEYQQALLDLKSLLDARIQETDDGDKFVWLSADGREIGEMKA